MDKRAQYLLEILDKIGSPLMQGITKVSQAQGADAAQKDAQMMAAMLGRTVQASIDLGQAMDVNPVQAGDDSLRVALAGLAAPLVAGQMLKKRGVPDEAELKRIITALQAVLTFSDNFTPSDESAARLGALEARGQAVDAYQAQIQYVHAFVPVIQAISKFAFGQAEQKLIVDVTRRLVERAGALRASLVPQAQGDEAKRIETAMLGAMAALYSGAHEAEVAKAGAAVGVDASPGGGPSIEGVWKAFDLQVGMVEALMEGLLPPSDQSGGAASGGPATEPQAQEQPQVQPQVQPQAPVQAQAPAQEQQQVQQQVQQSPPPPPPPPAAQESPQQAAPPAGGNPMSMFAKPKEGGQEAPQQQSPAQQAPPPAQPPPQEAASAPPVSDPQTAPSAGGNPMAMFAKPKEGTAQTSPAPPPQEQQPQQQPSVQPPPQAPAQEPAEKSDAAQEGTGNGGGPMSFFKKKEE